MTSDHGAVASFTDDTGGGTHLSACHFAEELEGATSKLGEPTLAEGVS